MKKRDVVVSHLTPAEAFHFYRVNADNIIRINLTAEAVVRLYRAKRVYTNKPVQATWFRRTSNGSVLKLVSRGI